MSSIRTGTVTGINIVPYDATKDDTNNPNSSKYYSPYRYDSIIDNLKHIKEVLVLNIQNDIGGFQEIERIADLGITSSWFYAMNCLAVRLYDGSVLFASIAVECILNHDLRLDEDRIKAKKYYWLDLDVKNITLAYKKGLPTNLLLNPNETFEKKKIEFVKRRNKVAHGDVEGYYEMYPSGFDKKIFDAKVFQAGHKRPSKEHAIDQMNKAKDFIIAWANQKPQVRIH